jgi:hypothetical protein
MIRHLLHDFFRRRWWVYLFALLWVMFVGMSFQASDARQSSPVMALLFAVVLVGPVDLEVRLAANGRFLSSLPSRFLNRCGHYWSVGVVLPTATAVAGLLAVNLWYPSRIRDSSHLEHLALFSLMVVCCCAAWFLAVLRMAFHQPGRKGSSNQLAFAGVFALFVLAGVSSLQNLAGLWGTPAIRIAVYFALAVFALFLSRHLTPFFLEASVVVHGDYHPVDPCPRESVRAKWRPTHWDRVQMNPLTAMPANMLVAIPLAVLPFGLWLIGFQWLGGSTLKEKGVWSFLSTTLTSPPMIVVGLAPIFTLAIGWLGASRFFASLPLTRFRLFLGFLATVALGFLPLGLLVTVSVTSGWMDLKYPLAVVWMLGYGALLLISAIFLRWGNLSFGAFAGAFAAILGMSLTGGGATVVSGQIIQLLAAAFLGVSALILRDSFYNQSKTFQERLQHSWTGEA